jgi:polar amino acid transport system substrate-binding protein
MTLKRVSLAALFCLGGALNNATAALPRLHLMTEATPPVSMREGNEIIGSGTDKVREIMARAGFAYTLDLLPWRRAYTLARQEPQACLFSTARTPGRENQFKWVGPIDEGEWVLLGRADRQYRLRTLEDARKLRIGTYNGDVRDEYLRARGFNVDAAHNDSANPRKLLMNRIDLWAGGLRRSSTLLKRDGWESQIVPVLSFNRVQLYLACNTAVPSEMVDKMNAAIGAMVRDGTVKRIDRKYEKWAEPSTPKP